MKKFSLLTLIALSAFVFSFTPKQAGVWTLDKNHAKLGFTVTHLLVSDVDGSFTKFDAKIIATKADFTDAVLELTADASSINTDNEKRDTHLRSADFFDVAKYPTINFRSTSFTSAGPSKYTIKGNLTMHGVTKPVTLTATVKQGINPMSKAAVAGFKVTGTLKRSEFNMGGFPTAVVSDEVTINANGEFGKN